MSANVREIQRIRDFRLNLKRFAEELESAIQLMQMSNMRSTEWIQHEVPRYWVNQSRRAQELVTSARIAFETCKLRTVAGRTPACIDEKVAWDRAKRREEFCREQQVVTRKWMQKIPHDIDEFRGRISSLQSLLELDIPQALVWLDQRASALEAYSDINRSEQIQPD